MKEPLPLKDIHLPAPVSWWPPAPGWWLLAGLLVALLAAAIWWRRRTGPRRAALAELAALRAAFVEHGDVQHLLRELSTLLRRVALAHYPRTRVAGLQGTAWLEFLDRTGPGGFCDGPGQALADAPFRPAAAIDPAPLLTHCERWIKAQRLGRSVEAGR